MNPTVSPAVNDALCDNWDRHWADFSAASQFGPATAMRCRLVLELLAAADHPSVRMLELGSGAGEFARLFHGRYPRAHFLGLDRSRVAVEHAAGRVPGAEFRERDLLAPLPAGRQANWGATHALCCEVLEHVDDPVSLLRNAFAYMVPGCRFVVTVPGGPLNAFYRHIGHRCHYTPAELAQLLAEAGFQVETAYGAGFPFFNLYRMLLQMRGEKLVQDVSGEPSFMIRFGAAVFDLLFRCNFGRRWGWQTVAVARRP